jgi:hypothetical protein
MITAQIAVCTVQQTREPGPDWGWCYVDQVFLEPARVAEARR